MYESCSSLEQTTERVIERERKQKSLVFFSLFAYKEGKQERTGLTIGRREMEKDFFFLFR